VKKSRKYYLELSQAVSASLLLSFWSDTFGAVAQALQADSGGKY